MRAEENQQLTFLEDIDQSERFDCDKLSDLLNQVLDSTDKSDEYWIFLFKRLGRIELECLAKRLCLTDTTVFFSEDERSMVLNGSLVIKGKIIIVEVRLANPCQKTKSFVTYTSKEMSKKDQPLEKFFFDTLKEDWVIDVLQELERTRSALHRNS